MIIHIDRAWEKKGYTISRVFINGERFGDGKKWCSILEDEDRGLNSEMPVKEILKYKIYGSTAIPKGVYEVKMYSSQKFGRVPILVNVPAYTGVLIHAGNTAKDTLGCLLPGVNDAVGRVSNSRYWATKIKQMVDAAEKRGERVWIKVG